MKFPSLYTLKPDAFFLFSRSSSSFFSEFFFAITVKLDTAQVQIISLFTFFSSTLTKHTTYTQLITNVEKNSNIDTRLYFPLSRSLSLGIWYLLSLQQQQPPHQHLFNFKFQLHIYLFQFIFLTHMFISSCFDDWNNYSFFFSFSFSSVFSVLTTTTTPKTTTTLIKAITKKPKSFRSLTRPQRPLQVNFFQILNHAFFHSWDYS